MLSYVTVCYDMGHHVIVIAYHNTITITIPICYSVLWYATVCYDMLCSGMLRYATICYVMLQYITEHYSMLRYVIVGIPTSGAELTHR